MIHNEPTAGALDASTVGGTMTRRPKPLTVRGVLKGTRRRPPTASDSRWYWQLYYNEGGKQHRVNGAPSGRYTRAEARAALEAAWASGAWQSHNDAPAAPRATTGNTVGRLLDLYLHHQRQQEARERISPRTLDSYRHARQRCTSLDGVLVARLDVGTIQRWIDELDDAGLAPATIRQTLRLVQMAWKYGRARGWVPARDLPRPQLPRARRVIADHTPSYAEIEAVRAQLRREWAKAYLDALTETGARPGEVGCWRWQTYRDGDRVLLDGKTGPRWVPATVRLRAVLEQWHQASGSPDRGPVWTVDNPQRSLNRSLKRACARAGGPAWTCYGPRRRVASTLIARIGVDGFGVHAYEAWMGHSYEIGRRIYAEVEGSQLDQAAAVLDEVSGVVNLTAERRRRG